MGGRGQTVGLEESGDPFGIVLVHLTAEGAHEIATWLSAHPQQANGPSTRFSAVTARSGSLVRRLDVADAVIIGVGSMLGAGVFAVWGPAAAAAGGALLIGLALAAVVAFCNATSSAQLAARHPESGGTYVYARERLSPLWGFVAGWTFVVGKTASCCAISLTVGAYLWPEQTRLVAALSVVIITAVNLGGLTRTVTVTKVVLAGVAATLALGLIAGWTTPGAALADIAPIDDVGLDDILRSGGLIFFAFAGYARIATLGEEVREPERTIPRAIPRALLAVLVIYVLVALTVLSAVPLDQLRTSVAPLEVMVVASNLDALAPLIRIGAAVAAFGVLLNLIPGVSRTILAMGRRHELPGWFAAVDTQRSLPLRAELSLSGVIVVLVLFTDLTAAISASGVAVLAYYALTNLSALRLRRAERIWPPAIAVVGLMGCVVLGLSLPPTAIVVAAGATGLGLAGRWLSLRRAGAGRSSG